MSYISQTNKHLLVGALVTYVGYRRDVYNKLCIVIEIEDEEETDYQCVYLLCNGIVINTYAEHCKYITDS